MRRRAFTFALAASVLAHAALIAGLPGTHPPPEPPTRTLTAQLEPTVVPSLPPAAAAIPPASRQLRRPAARPARPQATPAEPPPAAVVASPTPPAPAAEEPPLPQPEPSAVPVAEEDRPAPAAIAEAAASAAEPEAAPGTPTDVGRAAELPLAIEPSSGTIEYDLVYRGGSIGRSVQTWRIDRTSYRLTSLSEPTGLVALFYSHQFAYTSEGRVGPAGLMPEHFTARSGRRGARRSQATFDWTRRELTLQQAAAPRTLPLAEGTQDLLSFVYQLALGPLEPGTRKMMITSGTKVDTYELDVGPEEAIDLPAGPTRAIPIRRIAAPGEESMQLWVRATPPRVPVRVRFFDRSGAMTIEQLAARIDFDGT